MLRNERIMIHAVRGNPNKGIVHEQTDHGADHENQNLHPSGHVITRFEHQFHAGGVVENQGNNERNRRGDHVMHMEDANKQIQDAPVDNEGDHTYKTEFHKLFNQFSHTDN